MCKFHHYKALITWTGNKGFGTKSYNGYQRSHSILVQGKPVIEASSDPSFLGNANTYNPEELFLSSLSSCHMLWYLHLCSAHGIIVHEYKDNCIAQMVVENDGSGRFTSVTLHPEVIVETESMIAQSESLHNEANKMCFIANSCNFKILHFPSSRVK